MNDLYAFSSATSPHALFTIAANLFFPHAVMQNSFSGSIGALQATEKKHCFHMPRLVTSICSDQWATLHGWYDLHGDDSLPSAEVTESPQCVFFSIHLCIPLQHAVQFFDGITFAELSDADFFPFPFPKEIFGHFAGRSKEELKWSSLVLSPSPPRQSKSTIPREKAKSPLQSENCLPPWSSNTQQSTLCPAASYVPQIKKKNR